MEHTTFENLYDAYRYLRIINAYNAYLAQYNDNTAAHTRKYFELKSRHVKNIRPVLLILFALPMLFVSLCICFAASDMTGRIVGFTMLAVICVSLFVIITGSRKSADKQNRRFTKEAEDYWQKTGGPAKQENDQMIQKIHGEMNRFKEKNAFVLDSIPADYQNEYACGFFLTAISNGRADTLKEAINLYEEYLHRRRLENAAQRTAEAIQDLHFAVATQMEEINANLDKANSKLRDIETLEFYNAFIKDK